MKFWMRTFPDVSCLAAASRNFWMVMTSLEERNEGHLLASTKHSQKSTFPHDYDNKVILSCVARFYETRLMPSESTLQVPLG